MADDLKPPITGYSLWLMADTESQVLLQKLVNSMAEAYQCEPFIAHTTLLGLLDYTPARLNEISIGTDRLAEKHAPFFLELTGPGMRNAYFQLVFLNAVPSKKIVALNEMSRELFSKNSDPPFMPHASVVYGDSVLTDKSKIAKSILQWMPFPRSIRIEAIAIVDVHGTPSQWHEVARYPLKQPL